MDEQELNQFDFSINPNAPLFVIGVVKEMVDIPIWTLRKIDEMGIVSPKRIGTKTRCYTKQQITQLIHIRYLMKEKRVNISGVKVIIEMNYKKEHQDV